MSFPLDFIKESSIIKAVLSVGKYKNSWNIFVYKEEDTEFTVPVFTNLEKDLISLIENGGKAVFAMNKDNLQNPIEGLFKPVFWSPAYFPSTRACGLICDKSHHIFDSFPTDEYADFQWKHPIDNSVGVDVSMLDKDFPYIIEPVPNFFDNTRRSPLFEARVGKCDILFCGFNLDIKNMTVKALKNSIAKYVNSDLFKPTARLSLEDVKGLIK